MRGTVNLGILITIIFLIPVVLAIEDFSASLSPSLTLCTSTTEVESLLISNTGDTVSEYVVVPQSNHIVPVPQFTLLSPGETAELLLYYNFPKSTISEIGIDIQTKNGLKKTILKQVNAQKCNNNNLLAFNFNQTACPCLPMQYDFTIQNTGKSTETYVFGLDKFSEYASLSANPMVLQPGETRDLQLTFNLDCSINGAKLVNFFSNAQESGITTKVPLLLNINACYDYSLSTGKNIPNNEDKFEVAYSKFEGIYNVCADESSSIQIEIDNFGYIGNNFTYTLEGPEWTSLHNDAILLDGADKGYTYLDLSPSRANLGNHKLILNVDTGIGNNKKQELVDVNIVECHGLIVELPQEEQICNCIESEIEVDIINTGKSEEVIDLALEGTEFLFLENDSISIEPGSSKRMKLKSSVDCDVRGNNNVKVSAQTDIAYAEDTMSLEVLPVQECYNLDIETPNRFKVGNFNLIPINVVHTGVKEAEYSVELISDDWVTLELEEFTLSPGETFSFNVIANPENISEGTYDAEINIKSENVIYQKTFSLQKGETFQDSTREFISFNRYWIYTSLILLIILAILVFFASRKIKAWRIRKIIRKSSQTKKSRWFIYLFILILIVLALLFAYSSLARFLLSFFVEYLGYVFAGFLILIVIIYVLNSIDKK